MGISDLRTAFSFGLGAAGHIDTIYGDYEPESSRLITTVRVIAADGSVHEWSGFLTDAQSARAAGTTLATTILESVVPTSITNAQARVFLASVPNPSGAGTLFDVVDAWVKGRGGAALQWWEYSNDISRTGDLMAAAIADLHLDGATVDAWFRQASKLRG